MTGGDRDFKFSAYVERSKSYPMHDKRPLKGEWSLSRDLFKF